MHESKPRYLEKRIDNTVLAFKAARLAKGLTRKQAAELCGCSRKAFEQIENGRCNFSEDRMHKLVLGMGVSLNEFKAFVKQPHKALAEIEAHDATIERRPRRNLYKDVTKEVRVIKILRKKKGISQRQASKLCGLSKSTFSHIENGRTDLKKPRIEHLLKCLGYEWSDFEQLVGASILRDELMRETISILERLDDHVLSSTVSIIKALQK